MSESTSGYAVSVEDHDKVRVLVLDRPTKLNAFTAEGYRALQGATRTRPPQTLVSRCAC